MATRDDDGALSAALARAEQAHRPGHHEGVATLVDGATWRSLVRDEGLVEPVPAPRPVVILGAARSGTTWLQERLIAHPDVAGPRAETFLFHALRPAWLAAAGTARVRAIALHALDRHRGATRPQATHVVEKTPMHVFALDMLAEILPDACYVHLVRDGRDVARSMTQVDFFGDDTDLEAAARLWARAVTTISGSGLVTVELRYEDLLGDLEIGLTRVARAAGLRADAEALAAMTEGAGERVSRHGTGGRVGARQWEDLGRAQLRRLEREHGALLAAHGYAPAARRQWPRRWRQ